MVATIFKTRKKFVTLCLLPWTTKSSQNDGILLNTPVTQGQPTPQRTTNATKINKQS